MKTKTEFSIYLLTNENGQRLLQEFSGHKFVTTATFKTMLVTKPVNASIVNRKN